MKTMLPCPFCGHVPDVTDPDSVYPVNRYRDEGQIFRAGCEEAAGGCGAEVLGFSPEDAIKRWNTRIE